MPSAKRPVHAKAWSLFEEINVPVAQVGEKIGGKVGHNIAAGIFENACPIRMSYVLNRSGFPIAKPVTGGYSAVSGADRKWYLFRVNELMTYLEKTFGKADATFANPTREDFAEMQGILVVRGKGWSNATGHVTLWNGDTCPDHCHLSGDPTNGAFVPDKAKLWYLQ